jgi:hypothetical protein
MSKKTTKKGLIHVIHTPTTNTILFLFFLKFKKFLEIVYSNVNKLQFCEKIKKNCMETWEVELELEQEWQNLLRTLTELFGKTPDLNGVLFLIGVQELGLGLKTFSKEDKQDLMHWAICRVLSLSGFYEAEGKDADGWIHWKAVKKMPYLDLLTQEKFLQEHILLYFKTEVFTS